MRFTASACTFGFPLYPRFVILKPAMPTSKLPSVVRSSIPSACSKWRACSTCRWRSGPSQRFRVDLPDDCWHEDRGGSG